MLIIASDSGKVRALENPDESDETIIILDLRLENKEICTNGERGLQSVAIHPDFEENLFVYVFYMSYKEVRMMSSISYSLMIANNFSFGFGHCLTITYIWNRAALRDPRSHPPMSLIDTGWIPIH